MLYQTLKQQYEDDITQLIKASAFKKKHSFRKFNNFLRDEDRIEQNIPDQRHAMENNIMTYYSNCLKGRFVLCESYLLSKFIVLSSIAQKEMGLGKKSI